MSSMRSLLLVSLLILLECVLTLSSPPVPQIQCPVGVSIEAALYFKTLDDMTTPASVTSTITSMSSSEKRAELVSELDEVLVLSQSDLEALSDSDLVNAASLYYGLTETLQTSHNTSSLNLLQLRDLAEVEVTSQFSGTAKEYLLWTFGSLSDQQLILVACNAEFLVPSGKTDSRGEESSST